MRQAGRPPLWKEIDEDLRAFGGTRAVVLKLDAEGVVSREIGRRLQGLTGREVSGSTVRSWCKRWKAEAAA